MCISDGASVNGVFIPCREAALPSVVDEGELAPAMALNGGVAYSGGICGAISGVARSIVGATRFATSRAYQRR